MSDLQNPPGSTFQALPRLPLASAGVLLLAGVLGAVSLGVAWSGFEVSGTDPSFFGAGGGGFHGEGRYGAFALTFVGGEEPYSGAGLDDMDGVGLLRAGGPLLAVGMSLAFVAAVLVALDLSVPERHLDAVAAGTAALGFLLLLAALIVLPMGIAESVDASFGGTATASWSAGFFLAVAAGLLALAGTVTTLVHRLRAPSPDAPTGA